MADEIKPLVDAPQPMLGHVDHPPSRQERQLSHAYRHEAAAKEVARRVRELKALGEDAAEHEARMARHIARAEALKRYAAPRPLLRGVKGGTYFVCGSGRRVYVGRCRTQGETNG